MNLSFDHLDELNDFLRWADRYRAPGAREPDAPAPDTPYPKIEAPRMPPPVTGDPSGACLAPVTADADGAVLLAVAGSGTKDANGPATAEPTKRKRRTKAEIEADEKAAAAAGAIATQAITSKTYPDGTTVTGTSLPEQSPAQQDAAAGQPQGANPFAQSAATSAGDGTAATGTPDDDPAEAVVTPFQHIVRAREFVAKHGMTRYNETFAKAGLDANVMAYTAYQRGMHMAAMDEMDKG